MKREVDFCVVGGGPAGIAAALAASRHGAKTVLVHDRPMPGGNASSEVRMWICGALGRDLRETGIVEELLLENLARNPGASPSLWDSVLYGALEYAPGLELVLNCSINSLEMEGGRISLVRGWQSTTYEPVEIHARIFADCSGDSVLAPLSGARFRHGRESRHEFGETIEPERGDSHTMGSSCLIQARETVTIQKFTPPAWARKFTSPEELPPHRGYRIEGLENFWWLETGGMGNTIADAERNRHELIELALGVWDYLKNYAPDRERNANWQLEWLGFLPGKRESRRYEGDYILNQRDVQSGGRFADIIAYGGWPLDDHHPGGFAWYGEPNISLPVPEPFGIPYRCLYSANVDNLMFAGRNISVSHAALSSTRVMATCMTLGQACGTAAALGIREEMSPREVGSRRIDELQQQLLEDDCFLPGVRRRVPELSRRARLEVSNGKDAEALRDGFDRPDRTGEHAWEAAAGESACYRFAEPAPLGRIRIVFDSDLNRPEKNVVALRTLDQPELHLPGTLFESFSLDYLDLSGEWHRLAEVSGNRRRLAVIDGSGRMASALRLILGKTYGNSGSRVFAFDVANS